MQRLTELKKKKRLLMSSLINALNVSEDWQNYFKHKVFSRIYKHFN